VTRDDCLAPYDVMPADEKARDTNEGWTIDIAARCPNVWISTAESMLPDARFGNYLAKTADACLATDAQFSTAAGASAVPASGAPPHPNEHAHHRHDCYAEDKRGGLPSPAAKDQPGEPEHGCDEDYERKSVAPRQAA
jgi:hypothetical protein